MTRANPSLLLLAAAVAAGVPGAAQTTHHSPSTVHHATTAAGPVTPSDCVTVPTLPATIPAVPAGTPCPKAMITVSEDIQFSPLVGPQLRSAFPNLPSKFSLDYQDLLVGTGPLSQPRMWYTVRYTGYLPDGTKFDASDDHAETKAGFSFPYAAHRVIPGWDMGFEGMHVGGKRRLFIPYQLAYGERGSPPNIPPRSELIFDMELLAQSPTDPNAPPPPPTPPVPAAGTAPAGTLPGAATPATPPAAPPATAPSQPAAPKPSTPQ